MAQRLFKPHVSISDPNSEFYCNEPNLAYILYCSNVNLRTSWPHGSINNQSPKTSETGDFAHALSQAWNSIFLSPAQNLLIFQSPK